MVDFEKCRSTQYSFKTKKVKVVHGRGGIIHEKFVWFVECNTGTSGAAVAEKIRETIKDLGLDIKD